jgi:hypothetical protein
LTSQDHRCRFIVATEGYLAVESTAIFFYTLEKLLADVCPANLHGETDWGPPAGVGVRGVLVTERKRDVPPAWPAVVIVKGWNVSTGTTF